jgi:CheY-like chemotaxis protein
MPDLVDAILPLPIPPLPFSAPDPVYLEMTSRGRKLDTAPVSRNKRGVRRKTRGNQVLMIGRLRELALYRAEVLRSHGFTVAAPASKEEAIAAIRRGHFDAAILTYTLSSDTVQELAELIGEYCPDCPIIAISNTKKEDREIDPDEIVLADEGPRGLLAALRRVTRRN